MSNPIKAPQRSAAMPLIVQALQARNEATFMAQKTAEVEAARLKALGPLLFSRPKQPLLPFRVLMRYVPQIARLWERRIILKSGLFDAKWYLARNADVRDAGVDPARHFLMWGGADRRDPSPHFSSGSYLDLHPDVAGSGANPLVHFLKTGWAEQRETRVAGEKR